MDSHRNDPKTLLRIDNLTKSFGSLVANSDVSLDIDRGEIHCLLGENGAGKSTLSECLYGFYKPDAGRITFKDKPLVLNSPRDAVEAGIGMVHQHFILAQPLSVVENIVVGTHIKGLRTHLKQAAAKISDLCSQYDICMDPFARVSSLSVGQQQWVEILKALYVGIDLLILDEPTAVLTPQESLKLFSILKKMTGLGLSILLITHKLYEVLSVSDRVTVLRKGKRIATVNTRDTNRDDLARMMVGRVVNFKVSKEVLLPGEAVLDLRDIAARKENGLPALDCLNLTVHSREIVGLAGVAGNGQKELFDLIVGVQKAVSGKMILAGHDLTNQPPAAISAKGLASIPPDRIHEGLLMGFSVQENLVLGMQNQPEFQRFGLFNQGALDRFSQKSIADYDIAAQSARQCARNLSGGNLQKVILARELSQKLKCVLASSPTRGLDVGAMEYVHNKLVQLRAEGSGILLISEDLDEIFNLADIVAVIFKGHIVGLKKVEETTREEVGLLMAGIDGAAEGSR
ncbi:MAG TPA: ABC transporter ATP-binding protein [Anaerolineaceae bacterium]